MDMLTAEQVAKELGYHLHHVYRLLAEGTIKGKKWANRSWMIERAEVERIKALQNEYGRLPKGHI